MVEVEVYLAKLKLHSENSFNIVNILASLKFKNADSKEARVGARGNNVDI